MIRKSIFNALIDKTNPFKLVDKASYITKENLIGRIKRVQSIIVNNNARRISIVTAELTSNTIVTYLAALFLGVDVVFISYKAKVTDIISIVARSNTNIIFADAAMIRKLITENPSLVCPLANIVNINSYECKHESVLHPIDLEVKKLIELTYRDCVSNVELYYNEYFRCYEQTSVDGIDISNFNTVPIKVDEPVFAYNVHPHIIHYAVLNSILAGSVLKLRTVIENKSVVFLDANDILDLAIEERLNLAPISDETMLDHIKLYLNNLRAKNRLKTTLKGKFVLVVDSEGVWDLLQPLKLNKLNRRGYRPNQNKVSYPIWQINPERAVEITALFNLPIKDSHYVRMDRKNVLFVVPDMVANILSTEEFSRKTEQFKELFNRKYQTYVTPQGYPIAIDQVALLPA